MRARELLRPMIAMKPGVACRMRRAFESLLQGGGGISYYSAAWL
jgi:hypothetical protein